MIECERVSKGWLEGGREGEHVGGLEGGRETCYCQTSGLACVCTHMSHPSRPRTGDMREIEHVARAVLLHWRGAFVQGG